ncbi:MAG: NUDIX domain-containing protein, partial [Thermodesulfobacteriota bacterium]
MKTSASFPDPKRIRRALTGWYDRHRRKPDCPVCPLQDDCRARVQGLVHRLPVRGKKKSIPHREVVSAVIRDGNGRLLIVQRPARGLLGSRWKFPGGILNPEAPPEEGLVRIARKALG